MTEPDSFQQCLLKGAQTGTQEERWEAVLCLQLMGHWHKLPIGCRSPCWLQQPPGHGPAHPALSAPAGVGHRLQSFLSTSAIL